MSNSKIGKPNDQRLALVRNQATDVIWIGRIETTLDRAKEVAKYVEKCITIARKGYKDVITEEQVVTDAKGKEKKTQISKDGPAKLNARRKLTALLFDRQEQRMKGEKKDAFVARTNGIKHPVIEKLFDDLAPKYDARAEEKGTAGGYTRILKTTVRRGDSAQLAIVELV